jgi:hypothetical protein
MARRGSTGMDGAKVRMPSGRYISEITDLRNATTDEVAWMVASTMFSHAEGERFYGSIDFAMRLAWDENQPGHGYAQRRARARGVSAALHRNGFTHHQDKDKHNGERFFWLVPPVFPAWQSAYSTYPYVEDDGAQTTGGPVKQMRVTPQARELMAAIDGHPRKHARDYAKMLGIKASAVSQRARWLRDNGFITVEGNRTSSVYVPTRKPFPRPKGNGQTGKTVVIRETQPVSEALVGKAEAEAEAEAVVTARELVTEVSKADAIESQTGGTVVYDKAGHMLVVKDGKVYRPVMGWTLEEVTI